MKAYSSFPNWITLTEMKELEVDERENPWFDDSQICLSIYEAKWVCQDPKKALWYVFAGALHGVNPETDEKPEDITLSEWKKFVKAWNDPLGHVYEIDVTNAKSVTKDPDGGELFIKVSPKLVIKHPRLSKIEIHVGSALGYGNIEFWQELAKEFPQALYHGNAYRAINLKEGELDQDRLRQAGESWSISLGGVKHFLTAGSTYESPTDQSFYLAEATLTGFSLPHLAQFLKQEGGGDFFDPKTHKWILSEAEVISLEIIDIISTKFFNKTEDLPQE